MTKRILQFALVMLAQTNLVLAATLTPIEDARPAPPINLSDVAGTMHSLKNHSGSVVMVNFWASWCPPCLKELPSMQSLWLKLKQKEFVMLAVNVGEEQKDVQTFLDDYDTKLDFTILLDKQLKVTKSWPVFGLPTTFIVDRQGKLVYKALGERNWTDSEIVTLISDLFSESGE